MICKQKLYNAMDRLGFRESNPGTRHIRAAVEIVDRDHAAMMCKDVYPALAKENRRSPAAIERSMRTAIAAASSSPMWEKEWREIGGWNRPSNSEVVRRLARECGAD